MVLVAQAAVATRNLPLLLELVQLEANSENNIQDNLHHPAELYDAALRLIQIQSIQINAHHRRYLCYYSGILASSLALRNAEVLSMRVYSAYVKRCINAMETKELYSACLYVNAGYIHNNKKISCKFLLTAVHMPLLKILYTIHKVPLSRLTNDHDILFYNVDNESKRPVSRSCGTHLSTENIDKIQKDTLNHFHTIRHPDMLLVALVVDILRRIAPYSRILTTTTDVILNIFVETKKLSAWANITAVAVEFAYETFYYSYPFAALKVVRIGLKSGALSPSRAINMVTGLQKKSIMCFQIQSSDSNMMNLGKINVEEKTMAKGEKEAGNAIANFMALSLICSDGYDAILENVLNAEIIVPFQDALLEEGIRRLHLKLISKEKKEKMILRDYKALVEEAVDVIHFLQSSVSLPTAALNQLIQHLYDIVQHEADLFCIQKNIKIRSFLSPALSISIELETIVIIIVNVILSMISIISTAEGAKRYVLHQQCLKLLQLFSSPFSASYNHLNGKMNTECLEMHSKTHEKVIINVNQSTLRVIHFFFQKCKHADAESVREIVLNWLLSRSHPLFVSILPQILREDEAKNDFSTIVQPLGINPPSGIIITKSAQVLFDAMQWACCDGEKSLIRELLAHVEPFALVPLIQLPLTCHNDEVHEYKDIKKAVGWCEAELQGRKKNKIKGLRKLQNDAIAVDINLLLTLSSGEHLEVLHDWPLLRNSLLRLHHFVSQRNSFSSNDYHFHSTLLKNMAAVLVKLQKPLICLIMEVSPKMELCREIETAVKEYLVWSERLFLSQLLISWFSNATLQAIKKSEGCETVIELYNQLLKKTMELLDASWEILRLFFIWKTSFQYDETEVYSKIKSDYMLDSKVNRDIVEVIQGLEEHANNLLFIQGHLWIKKGIDYLSPSVVNLTKRIELWCVLRVISSNAFSTSDKSHEDSNSSSKNVSSVIVERLCCDVVALNVLYESPPQAVLHHHFNASQKIQETNSRKEPLVSENLLRRNNSSMPNENSTKYLFEESNEEDRHLFRSLDLIAKSNRAGPHSYVYLNSFTVCFITVVHAITSYLVEDMASSKVKKDLKAINDFQQAICAQLRASELRTLHEAALRLCYMELCGYNHEGIHTDSKSNNRGANICIFFPWILAWATPSTTFYIELLNAFNFFHSNKTWGRQKESALYVHAFQRIAEVDQWYRTHAVRKDSYDHSIQKQDFLSSNGTFLLNYLIQQPPRNFEERAAHEKNIGRNLVSLTCPLFNEALVAAAFVCLAPSLKVDSMFSLPFSRNYSSSFGGLNTQLVDRTHSPLRARAREGEVGNDNDEKKMYSLLLSFPLVLQKELLPLWRQGRLTREQITAIDRCFEMFISSVVPFAAPLTLRRMAVIWFLITRGGFVNCGSTKTSEKFLISNVEGYESGVKEEFEACLTWMNNEGERFFVEILESRMKPLLSNGGEEGASFSRIHRPNGMFLHVKTTPWIRRQLYSCKSSPLKVRNLLRSVFTQGSAIEMITQCFPDVEALRSQIGKETPYPLTFSKKQRKEEEGNFSPKGSSRQLLPALGEVELECLLSIAGDKLPEEVNTTLFEVNMWRESERRFRRNREELQMGMRCKSKGVYVKSKEVAPLSQKSIPYWVNCVLRLVLQPNEHNDKHREETLPQADISKYAAMHHSSLHLRKRATPGEQLQFILSNCLLLSTIPDEVIDKGSPPHRELGIESWKDIFHRIHAEVKDLQRRSHEVQFCAIEHIQGDLNIQDQLETFILRECLDLYSSNENKESIPSQGEEADLRKENKDALWMINSLILCLDVIQKGRSLPFVMTNIYPLCNIAQVHQNFSQLATNHNDTFNNESSITQITIKSLTMWCNFVQYHVYELLFETPLVERFSEERMRAINCESAIEEAGNHLISASSVNVMQRASKELTEVTRPLMAFLRLLVMEGCLVELRLEKLLRQQIPWKRANTLRKEKNNKIDYMLRSLKKDKARIRSIMRNLSSIVRELVYTSLLDSTSVASIPKLFLDDNVVRSGLQTCILLGAWKDLRWICQKLLISRRPRESSGRITDEGKPLLTLLLPVSVAALFASLSRPTGSGSFSNEFKSFASSLDSPNQYVPRSPTGGYAEMDKKETDLGFTKEEGFENFIKFLSALEQILKIRIANATTQFGQEAYCQPGYVERLAFAHPLHALLAAFENHPPTSLQTREEFERMQRFLSFTTLLINPTHGAQLWNQVQQSNAVDQSIHGQQETYEEIPNVHTASLSDETVKSAVSCLLTSSPSDYKAFRRLESKLLMRQLPEIGKHEKKSASDSNSSSYSVKESKGGQSLQASWRIFTDALLYQPNLLSGKTVLRVFLSLRHLPHTKHFIPLVLSKAVVDACPTFSTALEMMAMSLHTLPRGEAAAVQHHILLCLLERLRRNPTNGGDNIDGQEMDGFTKGLEDYLYTPKLEFWSDKRAQNEREANFTLAEQKKGIIAVVCICLDLLQVYKGNRAVSLKGGAPIPQHVLSLLLHAAVSDIEVTCYIYGLFWQQPYPRVEGVKVFLSVLKAAQISRGERGQQKGLTVRAMVDFLFLSTGVVKVVNTPQGAVSTTDGVRQRRPRRFSDDNHRVLWQAFVRACRSGAVEEASASHIVNAYKSCSLIDEVEELLVNASYIKKKNEIV
ncbi:unnamed protein product [Phytomonas sp. Hart1]|nr:unnamed protein product [Phytomonas sp. Hart1]|eukprot:CCW67767.1 unnamed protein product [Phytomonas sp. isolate Hart1]